MYPQNPPQWLIFGTFFRRVMGRCNLLILKLAPEVGLEPTTLRLTATESVYFPTATDCYKLLPVMHSDPPALLKIATHICPIMTDFEGAWAQKWAQSFGHFWGKKARRILSPFYSVLHSLASTSRSPHKFYLCPTY